jgi:hypothetical protein
MAKARLRLVTPSTVLRTVMPRRPPNRDLRTREHLTEAEVERLMKATKDNRYGHRDATMIPMALPESPATLTLSFINRIDNG